MGKDDIVGLSGAPLKGGRRNKEGRALGTPIDTEAHSRPGYLSPTPFFSMQPEIVAGRLAFIVDAFRI